MTSVQDTNRSERVPDLAIDVYLVEHGYEVNYRLRGQSIGSECRDFGGSYPLSNIAEFLLKKLMQSIEEFRTGIDDEMATIYAIFEKGTDHGIYGPTMDLQDCLDYTPASTLHEFEIVEMRSYDNHRKTLKVWNQEKQDWI